MHVNRDDFSHDQFFITALAVGMQARDKVFIGVKDGDLWVIDLRVPPEVVQETVELGRGDDIIFIVGSGPRFRRELRIYYTYRSIWTGQRKRASSDDVVPWGSADGEQIHGLDNQHEMVSLAADWYEEFGDINQVMCGDLSAPQAVKGELFRRGYDGFKDGDGEKTCPLP